MPCSGSISPAAAAPCCACIGRGYHSDSELHSEFAWLRALEAGGIAVPRVIRSRQGRDFEIVTVSRADRSTADRCVRVDRGTPARLGRERHRAARRRVVASQYQRIGAIAARMHNHTAGWRHPAGFRRHAWDAAGLVGEQPLWGRFWELAALTPDPARSPAACAVLDRRGSGRTTARSRIATDSFMPIWSRRTCSSTAIGSA